MAEGRDRPGPVRHASVSPEIVIRGKQYPELFNFAQIQLIIIEPSRLINGTA